MNEKIGIIGYGNMGSAIAEGIKKAYRIAVYDRDRARTAKVSGIKVYPGIRELAQDSQAIILAVKPQDIDQVLREVKNFSQDKLIISIAAGINTQHIEKILGHVRVVRAMPNLGAKIAESVTCICKGAYASAGDLEFADELFSNIGAMQNIPEDLMNAATAISGSGPAYIFHFIQESSLDPKNIPNHTRHEIMMRLERAAESVGFDHETAATLSATTTNSSLLLLYKTNTKPQELIQQVSSRGGTTEAALKILNSGGTWDEAAAAALKRAQELARR